MKVLIALLFLLSITAHAETFTLKKDKWTAKIQVAHCDENTCSGKGRIELTTDKHKQTFYSEDFYVYRPNPNTPFDFDAMLNPADYNFDGKTDIAISQGNYGLYGSTIYNIYVQTNSGKFILSDELSDLTLDYMGLPEVDNQNQLLIVFSKVGYIYRDETHFRVRQKQKPALQKVYFQSTEYTPDDKIIETTEVLENGKLRKSVKTHNTN